MRGLWWGVVPAGDDTSFDLIDGCAGTIAGLTAWAAVRPAGAVTDALARCADRLVDQARPQPGGGTGWLPRPSPSAEWQPSRAGR
ncbi:hypothetical protein ACFU76_20905 [Streptomyces sp. NPDC057539]|uniref:hypothetical protein n=1 Tax=Streptomyces sp. NPDC057539 TaxID=3346159 RepID=UPI0036C8A70D